MMLPVFGLIFSGFVLVFCLGTMPSRLMFYYEQQVVAKYGRRAEVIVTHAHSEVLDDAVTLYHFDYEISYRKTRQFGTFYLEDSNLAA